MDPPAWAYQVENFEPPPDDELVCSVCQSVFCDPVQSPCNHVFCRACIHKWLEDNRTCPICRKLTARSTLQDVLPLIKNMIMKLSLRCRNTDCTVKFSLENCNSHLDNCEYETVICRNMPCRTKFFRKDQQQHENNICSYRFTRCKHCSLKVGLEPDSHDCITSLKQVLKDKDDLLKRKDDLLKKKDQTIRELEEKLKNPQGSRSSSNFSSSSWSSTVSDFSDVEISLDTVSTQTFNPSPFRDTDSPLSPLALLGEPFQDDPPTLPRQAKSAKRSYPTVLYSTDEDDDDYSPPRLAPKRPWCYSALDSDLPSASSGRTRENIRRFRPSLTSFTGNQPGTSRTRGFARFTSSLAEGDNNSDPEMTIEATDSNATSAANTSRTTRMQLPRREAGSGEVEPSSAANTSRTTRMQLPRREAISGEVEPSNAANTSRTTRMQLPRREAGSGEVEPSSAANTSRTTRMQLPRREAGSSEMEPSRQSRKDQAGTGSTTSAAAEPNSRVGSRYRQRMSSMIGSRQHMRSPRGTVTGTRSRSMIGSRKRLRSPRRSVTGNTNSSSATPSYRRRMRSGTESGLVIPSGTTRMQSGTDSSSVIPSGTQRMGLPKKEPLGDRNSINATFQSPPESPQLSPAESPRSDTFSDSSPARSSSSPEATNPLRAALFDIFESTVQSTLSNIHEEDFTRGANSDLWLPPNDEWSDYDMPSFDLPITSSDESSLLSTVSDVSSSSSVEAMTPPRSGTRRSDRMSFFSSDTSSDAD